MHLKARLVRGRATKLTESNATAAKEGDQAAGIDANGDGRSRRERESKRRKEKARGRDGVVCLEARWVRGRAAKLVGRDAMIAEEGDQAASIDTGGDGRREREREMGFVLRPLGYQCLQT